MGMCVIYQDICFWRNCLHVTNVTEFIAAESGAGQERFANLFFSSLYCHLGENLSLKRKKRRKRPQTVPRRSEMQSEYKEKQEDAKGKLQSDIQCTFC